MTQTFYDRLAPYYHLLYPDWEASMLRQSRGLAAVLSEFGVPAGGSILDAACGIGTQTLGLARLGYRVSATDISPVEVARARVEAEKRGLVVSFGVADLRQLSREVAHGFDAVLACDNAIPHLLSDDEIRSAFVECRRVLRPGGILVISVRDYATIERKSSDRRPYGTRTDGGCDYSAEQVWTWDGDQYDLVIRLTQKCGASEAIAQEFHSRYYAVELPTLERLLREAGFQSVWRRDEHFFQPLLVSVNP